MQKRDWTGKSWQVQAHEAKNLEAKFSEKSNEIRTQETLPSPS
jgi:hypothetical protein